MTRFCYSITKTQQQIYVFFNIIVAGDFFQAIICAFGT
ncbi:putative membrane protein [Shigella flexneri 2850-71]|nr:putative membrane protein [Shigella flexneri 2850-71]